MSANGPQSENAKFENILMIMANGQKEEALKLFRALDTTTKDASSLTEKDRFNAYKERRRKEELAKGGVSTTATKEEVAAEIARKAAKVEELRQEVDRLDLSISVGKECEKTIITQYGSKVAASLPASNGHCAPTPSLSSDTHKKTVVRY